MPFADDPDDDDGFVPPLHPDDRLWRHPSELGPARRADPAAAAPGAAPERVDTVGVPRAWTVAAASALLGVAVTLAVLSIVGTFDDDGVRTVVEQIEVAAPDGDTASAVTDRVVPALVQVVATRAGGSTTATGVVFRSDGHLLTTADAVEGATTVTVTTAAGSVLPATVVGVDDTADLAVLDVERDGMATAVLARVSDVEAGDQAVAVEREPGASSPGVATGHIRALGMRLDTADGASLHDMIEAALETAPDTAGAVLCSQNGAVLGLVTSRRPDGAPRYSATSIALAESTTTTTADPGLATLYATPIDYATQIADEIIETGTVRHTWLGVLGDDLHPTEAATLGRSGAALTRVVPDGPAAAAGLAEGDVVVALDGVQVTSMSSLVVALRSHGDGDVVTLTFVRDGAQRVATVTLTARG
jgi:putative serine protease PepD